MVALAPQLHFHHHRRVVSGLRYLQTHVGIVALLAGVFDALELAIRPHHFAGQAGQRKTYQSFGGGCRRRFQRASFYVALHFLVRRIGQCGLQHSHSSTHQQATARQQRGQRRALLGHIVYQVRSQTIHIYVLLERGHVVRFHGRSGLRQSTARPILQAPEIVVTPSPQDQQDDK